MALVLEERPQRLPGIRIVLDEQDRGGRPAGRRAGSGGGRRRWRVAQRQLDRERAPEPGSLTLGPHAAAVELDQPTHERQPDAQAARDAGERLVALGERLEDAG